MTGRQLAFIGLGNMGSGMAGSLLRAGHGVTVFNRTRAKAAALKEAGAKVADSPEEAAQSHRLFVLSLADEKAVEEILFERMVPHLAPGSIVVDTSTVSPGYAREAARRLVERGLRRVEACVVGNPLQARKGELRVFTAGSAEDCHEVADLLDAIGNETVHLGAPGTAASMKLILNLLLGAQVAAFAEAVAWGTRAGLDRDQLIGAVVGSGFSSLVLRFRAELMYKRAYEPAFFRSELMEKDLRIAIDDAALYGSGMPVLDAVRESFAAVLAAGDGDKDAAVLVEHAGGGKGVLAGADTATQHTAQH
ncbi:NAD(P)-dependent oxidoreductase [Streptomyces sp. NPDC056817]|uniref:NAD(P)-dependent oxidoreductase n=1 Tax=Streptomyces sp. NPDC056817 TaxID=3345950 RepID=UPI0036A83008